MPYAISGENRDEAEIRARRRRRRARDLTAGLAASFGWV